MTKLNFYLLGMNTDSNNVILELHCATFMQLTQKNTDLWTDSGFPKVVDRLTRWICQPDSQTKLGEKSFFPPVEGNGLNPSILGL